MIRHLLPIVIMFIISTPALLFGDDSDTDDFIDRMYWEEGIKNRAPLVRIGLGNAWIIDDDLDKYYDNGSAVMIDFIFYRSRNRPWKKRATGFDIYTRFTFREFEMVDDAVEKSGGELSSKSNIQMLSLDIGGRYLFGGLFLSELWQVYILAAPRLLYYEEESDNKSLAAEDKKDFIAMGIITGFGAEITLFPHMGIFFEYNIGYTPVGESRANVEGHQALAGITVRTPYR